MNHCSASGLPPQREQRLGIDVEEPDGGLARPLGIELRRRQNRQRLLILSEVGSGSGDHDSKLVGVITGQLRSLRALAQLDRALGTADATLAVGDHRQQHRLAAHPAGRAQFGEGLRPVAAAIRRDSDRLTDGSDPGGPVAGGLGMFERGFWVVLKEFACRNQMARNVIRGGFVQRDQFTAHVGRQLSGLDRGGQRRTGAL